MAGRASSGRFVTHTLAATLIAGAATYAFLGIVSRSLDDAEFDVFSVYWSVSLIVGFGLFLPVEQELARLGGGDASGAAAGRAGARVAAEIAVAACLLLLIGSPLLVAAGVAGEVLVVTGGFVLVSALQFLVRGWLLASRRLSAYANVLIADSGIRVVLATLVALIAGPFTSAGWFAAGLALAIVVAHAPALRGIDAAGRSAPGAAMRRAVLGLIAGTLAAQLLLNVGPVLINAADLPAGTAGAFQATFSVARIPLFVLIPLQGVVVGPLARLVAEGRTHRMTGLMLRVAAGAAAAGVVGAMLAYLLGPWMIELVFGAGRSLPAVAVAVLVLGVCVHCGLVLTTQALIAAERHARASTAWVFAAIVFAGLCFALWAPLGPVDAVVWSFLGASVVGWGLALLELAAVARRAARTKGE